MRSALGIIWLATACLSLSACGGGGGSAQSRGQLTLSTTHVEQTDYISIWSDSVQAVGGTVTGVEGTLYVLIQQTANGIEPVVTYVSGNSGIIEIRFKQSLPPGHYHDTITVQACLDQACTREIGGSPQTISVDYHRLEGGELLSTPDALSFSAIQGVTPEIPPLELDYTDGAATSWTATISYEDAAGWCHLGPLQGLVSDLPRQLTATADLLPVGTHRAVIRFVSDGGTVERLVPVDYTVLPPRTNPTTMSFVADPSSTEGALKQQIEVLPAFNNGATAGTVSWTATTNVPWLQVSPVSGDTASARFAIVSVLPAELTKLDYGTHEGELRIQSNASGVSPLIVPVRLNVLLPRVEYVVPHVVAPGSNGPAILRGHGFNSIGGFPLRVGEATVADFIVVDDTRIELTLPDVGAGTSAVNVVDQFGGNSTRAILTAIPPIPEGDSTTSPIQTGFGNVRKTIFDEERNAYYSVVSYVSSYGGSASYRLVAQRFDGNSWEQQVVALPNLPWDLVQSPDGRELIVVFSNQLQHFSPTDFADLGSVALADDDDYSMRLAGMLNDGRMLVQVRNTACGCSQRDDDEYWRVYDVRSRRFSGLVPGALPWDGNYNQQIVLPRMLDRIITQSSDGMTSVIGQGLEYVASGYTDASGIFSSDDRGTRLFQGNERLIRIDGDTVTWSTVYKSYANAVAISSDGHVGYFYNSQKGTLQAFDLDAEGYPLLAQRPTPEVRPGAIVSPQGTHLYMPGRSVALPTLP